MRSSNLTHLLISASLLALTLGPPAHGQLQPENPDGEAATAPAVPSDAELEASGAVIGTITLVRENVFDLSKPGENYALYRLANRWHIVTRDAVIRSQLLIKPGDPYSRQLLDESARLLRQNRYLFDARLSPSFYENGVVDITVKTRDVWTLTPDISFSRTGGEDKWRVGFAENNLLGIGTRIAFSYEENVDRDATVFEFSDKNLFRSRTQILLQIADTSDGGSERIRLRRPFYALDSRWAAGTELSSQEFENRFYDLGNEVAEYRQDSDFYSVFGGISSGLNNGWVRRWTAGLVQDDRQFSPVPDPEYPALLPENRRFVYPFVGIELLEDDYRTAANRDQFDRTEDFLLGTRFSASLGFASEKLDSDRDALLYRANFSRGFGSIEDKALLLATGVSGRVDEGDTENTLLTANARYYNQQSKKRLFFMSIRGAWGSDLDLDNLQTLGGSSGLRGYPLRYQSGDSRLLLSIEERYFTDWYPFRLFRVGFAAFADAGRTWGNNAIGNESVGWLTDVGIGLRLAPTRSSSGEIYHIDLAFPLNGDPSIDSVQLILEAKQAF